MLMRTVSHLLIMSTVKIVVVGMTIQRAELTVIICYFCVIVHAGCIQTKIITTLITIFHEIKLMNLS